MAIPVPPARVDAVQFKSKARFAGSCLNILAASGRRKACIEPSSRPNFWVIGSNNEQETCKLKISISLPFEILKLDERIIPPGNAKAVRRFQQLNCGYPNLNQRRPGQANSDGTLKAPCLRCYCNAPTPAPSASRAKPCRARSAIALARGAEAFSDSGRSSRIPSLTAYSRNR